MNKPRLSPRLEQVADLMRKGLKPAQIAAVLGINVQSVRNHMAGVYLHFGIYGSTRGKQQIFIEMAGSRKLEVQERRRIVNLDDVKQLQCASSEEIDNWRAGKPLTNMLVWRFCVDACHDWCVAQRAAGNCIRDDLEFQRIARQRREAA